jgi:hypothetical protein
LALGSSGASTYRDNIINGYQGIVHVGDIIDTETGNMTGPTSQGLHTRLIDRNTGSLLPSYNCTATSRPPNNKRYAIVPVTGDLGGGRSSVEVVDFWVVALHDPDGGNVDATFLKVYDGAEADPTKPPADGYLNATALVQ